MVGVWVWMFFFSMLWWSSYLTIADCTVYDCVFCFIGFNFAFFLFCRRRCVMRHPNEPNESDSFLCNWLHVWLWQELGASTLHHLGNRNCSQPLCMCTLGNRRGHIHPCRQNNLPKSLPSPCYMSRHRYHRCVCVCGCHDDLVSHSQGYLLTKQC